MPQRLNHLERGRRTDLHVSTLRKIAAALGVEPGELLK
jgi:DNA-binding Xre family transcriptional regulator